MMQLSKDNTPFWQCPYCCGLDVTESIKQNMIILQCAECDTLFSEKELGICYTIETLTENR